ncbi:rRNA processing/ribosome biogenesis-domain-containing protein [Neohortaea acidophila]|uniref:Pre-rRNA-processing protein RIX1 n=1 Tax=Neohortaea acidophila TaxID=245834 RepID=A0A6A6PYT5_9PEZI|nr:rRNA processing/ribosome biogenesis-domain-containing protein [Neohortaea acidophila]KAF2484623.1 rRNA processing/ribosome biogenesis-domain-containing protein [Neohortaea acidophila]
MKSSNSLPRSSASVASLRAITYRIASTPVQQLPHVAAQISSSLWNTRDLLSASPDQLKSNAEAATLVHRFTKTLFSLLQDRTVEGRWAAVVLLKATIEAGGLELLTKSGAWVRSLLAILKKPDPPTTRTLAVISITRIFTLTWDHTTLVREITTPSLPPFITSCLNNFEQKRCSANERQTILAAFATLLPRHPTVFRTFDKQIRALLVRIISSTSSSTASEVHYTVGEKEVARRLLALLHHCAPQQSGASKWAEGVKTAVATAHETCDVLFRAIIEDRQSTASNNIASKPTAATDQIANFLGSGPGRGVYADGEMLVELLVVLQSHLEVSTSGTVHVPVGLLVGLIHRVLNVTMPARSGDDGQKFNVEIAKDEREALFTVLPTIHIATMQLANTLLARFGTASVPYIPELLELVRHVFSQEKADVDIRMAVYETLRNLLDIIGPGMSKAEVADLAPIIRMCCEDLLPTDAPSSTTSVNGSSATPPAGVTAVSLRSASQDDRVASAHTLLPRLFTKINPAYNPRKVRVQMERTAILTKHEEALTACVMNPGSKDGQAGLSPSLLPMLARLFPESSGLEMILRPRMPVILSGSRATGASGTHTSHVEDVDMSGEASESEVEDLVEENIVAWPVAAEGEPAVNGSAATALTSSNASDALAKTHVEVGQPKRAASDSVEADMTPKRARTSPFKNFSRPLVDVHPVGQQEVESGAALPQLQEVQPLEPVQRAVMADIVAPGAAGVGPEEVTKGGDARIEIEDDDDDFEIPAINPDPDTDSEDEDDEEGDE